MRLFRRRKKSRSKDRAAVYHIASLLDEGVMSVDQLLAPAIWQDFPGDRADVERFLRQVADDPKTSEEDRRRIERHLSHSPR